MVFFFFFKAPLAILIVARADVSLSQGRKLLKPLCGSRDGSLYRHNGGYFREGRGPKIIKSQSILKMVGLTTSQLYYTAESKKFFSKMNFKAYTCVNT